jgi:hypothetical protein
MWVLRISRRWLWRMLFSGMWRRVRRSLVTANVVPSSSILVILLMEAIRSSETSMTLVLTRVIRRNIPEDAILQSSYCLLRTAILTCNNICFLLTILLFKLLDILPFNMIDLHDIVMLIFVSGEYFRNQQAKASRSFRRLLLQHNR